MLFFRSKGESHPLDAAEEYILAKNEREKKCQLSMGTPVSYSTNVIDFLIRAWWNFNI